MNEIQFGRGNRDKWEEHGFPMEDSYEHHGLELAKEDVVTGEGYRPDQQVNERFMQVADVERCVKAVTPRAHKLKGYSSIYEQSVLVTEDELHAMEVEMYEDTYILHKYMEYVAPIITHQTEGPRGCYQVLKAG